MKTNNLNIRTLLAGIALVLLTGSVYSQKSYKQSDFSNIFASIEERVILVPAIEVPKLRMIIVSNPDYLEYEEGIRLENWMFNDHHFILVNSYNYEIENSDRIENWMLDDNYFQTESSSNEVYVMEEEESNRIEDWMLDENYFNKSKAENIDNT